MGAEQAAGVDAERTLSLPLDVFAWEAVQTESTRLGVTAEELVAFSVLYYLADVDSGRVARRIARSPYPEASPLSER